MGEYSQIYKFKIFEEVHYFLCFTYSFIFLLSLCFYCDVMLKRAGCQNPANAVLNSSLTVVRINRCKHISMVKKIKFALNSIEFNF